MQNLLILYSLFQSFLGSAYLRNKVFVEGTVSDHSSGANSSIQLNTLSQSQKVFICPKRCTHTLGHAPWGFAKALNKESGTSTKTHWDPGPSFFRLPKITPLSIKKSMQFFLHN